MHNWKQSGEKFPFENEWFDFVEYGKIKVFVFIRSGKLYYTTRKRDPGGVIYYDPIPAKLITDKTNIVGPIKLILSNESGNFEAYPSGLDYSHYINPKNMPELNNPGPPKQIDEDFQLKNFKKIIATTFIPDLLINKKEFTHEDFMAYVDKAVRLNAFNVVRAHIYAVWSAEVNKLIYMPHPRNGKYDLTKYVKIYQDTIVKRLKYIKEAGIIPWIDIINGGSNSRWARYFLNPDLNSFNTHPWNQSIWHAYEYENDPAPEGPQYKQILKWFNQFFDEMVPLVEREAPGCLWSAHETRAGTDWHRKIYYAALKRNGVDSARITTNLDMDENDYPYAFADFNQKLHREGIIPDIMMLRVDGLYNEMRYDYYRSELTNDNGKKFKIIPDLRSNTDKPLPVIISGDGSAFPNEDLGYNMKGVFELIDIMKRDNHLGIEVNLGTWGGEHISQVDLETASKIANYARG